MGSKKTYREKYEAIRNKVDRLGQIYQVILGFLGVAMGIGALYYIFIQMGLLDKVKATNNGLVIGIIYGSVAIFILFIVANFCRSLAMFLTLRSDSEDDKAIKLCVLIDSIIVDFLLFIFGLVFVGIGIYVMISASVVSGIFTVVFGLVPIAFTVNDIATAYVSYKEYDYSLGEDQNEKYQRFIAKTNMLPSLAAGAVFALVPVILIAATVNTFVKEGFEPALLFASIFMGLIFGGLGVWIIVYTLKKYKQDS